jgi:hypothetical protein
MSIEFEDFAPPALALPNRTDVACFVGFVARRRGVPLPQGVLDELRALGWVKAPWKLGAGALQDDRTLQSVENLPVTVESWEAFSRLFAWEARALKANGNATCATYLGAAVRSFFARGGKRAVVVRVGDPWPYLESGANRSARRRARLNRLVPDFANRSAPTQPFDPAQPRQWRGLQHVYGLRDASLVCLPDLPDACAVEPPKPATDFPLPVPPEVFVECSADEPAPPPDNGLRLIPAPRLDSLSYAPWRVAVASARAFLQRWQREAVLVAAVPLAHPEASRVVKGGSVHAEVDMLAFLRRVGVFEPAGSFEPGDASPASAFVQLAYPWPCTRAGSDLPEGAEPPDGLIAGLMAANALTRGTFHSVAGLTSVPRLNDVHATVPPISWGAGADSPEEQLAERVCLLAPTPDGITLQSDVTSSPDPAWRFGGASRLMGAVIRAARRTGEAIVFEGNGPAVWSRVVRGMEALLAAFWRLGALRGDSADDAFSVRCDRSTMTQNDVDAGRLIVRISLQPAASIERITVVLDLASSGAAGATLREAA